MRVAPTSEYFGVNQVGLSTSYGVAGRLGECRRRHMLADDAIRDARRMNRAYALGYAHAVDALSKPPTKPIPAEVGPGDDPAGYAVDYPEIPFRD